MTERNAMMTRNHTQVPDAGPKGTVIVNGVGNKWRPSNYFLSRKPDFSVAIHNESGILKPPHNWQYISSIYVFYKSISLTERTEDGRQTVTKEMPAGLYIFPKGTRWYSISHQGSTFALQTCLGGFENVPRPYAYAAASDLEECLSHRGDKSIKIMIPDLNYDQIVSRGQKWSFRFDKQNQTVDLFGIIDPGDQIQLSAYNKDSRQDYHAHKNVVEIQFAEEPLTVTYGRTNTTIENILRHTTAPNSAVIFPAGQSHMTNIDGSGIGYCFQIVEGPGRIKGDKVLDLMNAELSRTKRD